MPDQLKEQKKRICTLRLGLAVTAQPRSSENVSQPPLECCAMPTLHRGKFASMDLKKARLELESRKLQNELPMFVHSSPVTIMTKASGVIAIVPSLDFGFSCLCAWGCES